MVSNILALTLLGGIFSHPFDISEESARQIATGFRDFASKDVVGNLLGDPPELGTIISYVEPERPEAFPFLFPDGLIAIAKSNGQILHAVLQRVQGPRPEWQSQVMSTNDLIARANHYFQGAGYTEQITFREKVRCDADGRLPNVFEMYFSRSIDGLRQHPQYDVEFDLEHVTGRLYFINVPVRPIPPPSQIPGVSSNFALINMIEYLQSKTGQSVFVENSPISLVSWAPNSDHLVPKLNELTSADIALGNSNQGVLTYCAELAAPMENDDAVPLVRYWVNADAATGRIFGSGRNGGFLGASSRKPKSIWLNLEPGDIKIVSGNKSELLKNASLSQVANSDKQVTGKPLLVMRNKVIWKMSYDAKSGLLWIKDGKVWKGAKPSENLRKAIERLVKLGNFSKSS